MPNLIRCWIIRHWNILKSKVPYFQAGVRVRVAGPDYKNFSDGPSYFDPNLINGIVGKICKRLCSASEY